MRLAEIMKPQAAGEQRHAVDQRLPDVTSVVAAVQWQPIGVGERQRVHTAAQLLLLIRVLGQVRPQDLHGVRVESEPAPALALR